MRYLLLIYTNEANDAQATQADQEAMMGAYWAFTKEVNEAGVNLASEALQPTSTATTVRVRDGKTLTTDGPFAETKEQLGGFYMVQADNLDELKSMIRDALRCHFDQESDIPPVIRLHFVRDEVIPFAV